MRNTFLALISACFCLNAFADHTPIVGGVDVDPNDPIAKTTVYLELSRPKGSHSSCTGVIVDADHVLTAAHCLDETLAITVKYRASDYEASSFYAFPGYPGRQRIVGEFVDLAWVTLRHPIEAPFEPARFFQTRFELESALYPKQTVTLAGFGIAYPAETSPEKRGSGTLRKTDMTFAQFTSHKLNLIFRSGAFIGKPEEGVHDACNGDSGGPALVLVDGKLIVVGITSRSNCMGQAIYTAVDQTNLPL